MPAITRIGDIAVGICCCHSVPCVGWVGVFVTGASKTNVENSPDSRVGDVVVGCHAQICVSGSPTVTTENSPTARIGDPTVGCTVGTIVTGGSISYADSN